jgi:hypothetical protein
MALTGRGVAPPNYIYTVMLMSVEIEGKAVSLDHFFCTYMKGGVRKALIPRLKHLSRIRAEWLTFENWLILERNLLLKSKPLRPKSKLAYFRKMAYYQK